MFIDDIYNRYLEWGFRHPRTYLTLWPLFALFIRVPVTLFLDLLSGAVYGMSSSFWDFVDGWEINFKAWWNTAFGRRDTSAFWSAVEKRKTRENT